MYAENPNGIEASREAGWVSEFLPLKTVELKVFPYYTKSQEPHVALWSQILEYLVYQINTIKCSDL